MAAVIPFPGEKSSGLIEAPLIESTIEGARAFPGEKSSGLIEATSDEHESSEIGRGFRGRNPPASLKLTFLPRLHKEPARFPGEKSSGLIEALRLLPHATGPARRFRGRNPPASLKLSL